jgi:hypothetical protein
VNARTTTWLAGSVAGFALTAVLLLLAAVDGPAWARTPLSVIVFLVATGFAVVGPGGGISTALRWALVPAISISASFLFAVALLDWRSFALPLYLALLMVVQAVGITVHLGLGRRAATRTERALA